jgi:hypothetical protein
MWNRGLDKNFKHGYIPFSGEMPIRSKQDQLENRLNGDINQKPPKGYYNPFRGFSGSSFDNPTFSF